LIDFLGFRSEKCYGKIEGQRIIFYGSCVLLLLIVITIVAVLLKSISKVDFGLLFLKWLIFDCLVGFNQGCVCCVLVFRFLGRTKLNWNKHLRLWCYKPIWTYPLGLAWWYWVGTWECAPPRGLGFDSLWCQFGWANL